MSSVYRNILVAVDGSPDADAALAHAGALARDQRARLTLLTAIPPLPATALLASGAAPPRSEVVRHYADLLRRAAETLPEDVSVTTLLVEGPASRVLVERARSGEFDLIVMGSHGHGRAAQRAAGLRVAEGPARQPDPRAAHQSTARGDRAGPGADLDGKFA